MDKEKENPINNKNKPPNDNFNFNLNNLNETQITYKIFITINNNNNNNDHKKDNIETLFKSMKDHLDSLSSFYIWNNERLILDESKLQLITSKKETNFNDKSIYLYKGQIDFGDNLEDEWFIVYLLKKLTAKYSGIVSAQCHDSDGEFILIQAANFLPKWASSAADASTLNRVFIFEDNIHIIPPTTTPASITYTPASGPIQDMEAALRTLIRFKTLTKASKSIQDCINQRLSIFEPTNQINLFHRQTCTIPAKLAWLLSNSPSLISVACNRFCEKHPDDLALCREFKYFKPTSELVNYRVLFTKHLYGKLKYCEYKSDKRHQWPTVEQLKESISLNLNDQNQMVTSMIVAGSDDNLQKITTPTIIVRI
jgi:hypothetical protein